MNTIELALASMTLLQMFVLIFGAHSITRLIVTDTLLDVPRNWIFDRFPPAGHTSDSKPPRGRAIHTTNGKWYTNKGVFLGELLSCPWCAGFWISLIVSASFVLFPVVTIAGLFPFALRSAVGVIAYHNGG